MRHEALTHALRLQRHRPAMALAYELTLAAARERECLANRLHDELGQLLALAQMRVDELAGGAEPAAVAVLATELRHLLDEAVEATHAATLDLHPPMLSQLGLLAAVRAAGERLGRLGRFSFEIEGALPPLGQPLAVQAVVLRVVRELMSNACRHARATRVTVSLCVVRSMLRIEVVDDGRGFDAHRGAGRYGLPSILSQMAAVGGRVEIDSRPGTGTRARVSLPLHARTVRA